jgi:hypothetical protein
MLPIIRHYLQQSRLSMFYSMLSIGLLLAIISAGLVACGSNSGVGSAPNPTPTLLARQCGSVQTNPRDIIVVKGPTAKQVADCFWQAYQKCRAATLSFTTTGIDTVLLRTFSIKSNGGQCLVTDTIRHAIVPSPLSPAKTYTCTGIIEQADGLHFSGCGTDGDVVIPL